MFTSGAGESGAAATDEISFLGTREIDGTPRVPRAIFDERTTLSGRNICRLRCNAGKESLICHFFSLICYD